MTSAPAPAAGTEPVTTAPSPQAFLTPGREGPAGLGRPVAPSRGALRPLGLDEVRITGGFWGERQRRNADATLQHVEHWLEREGWLGNFDAAVQGRLPRDRRGREFSDTEVYKWLEAMAWEMQRSGPGALQDRFDTVVVRVAAAQEPDGYLNTGFGRPGQPPRYSDLEWGHELYSFGHLIQAGVARARGVGLDDALVRIARRAADHVCEVFGTDGMATVCGHPEIEPALVELYRVTGERRYLEQARLFIERRGHQVLEEVEFGRSYFQDDMPVRQATVLRGHAVRATYLAAGAVDLASETGDDELLEAVAGQWRTTVARRTYVTGGMGSRHQDEAFGEDYVLPPDRAYSETCAGIGSVMLAWRLLLARGDAAYADLIERTLYNVVATSPSHDGTRFFYTNTLHQREQGEDPDPDRANGRAAASLRAPWFTVSCCPTNVARTIASLGAYLATVDDDGLQLHQYAPCLVNTVLPDGRAVSLRVDTDYPVTGSIRVTVLSGTEGSWALRMRIPAWAAGASVRVDGETTDAAPGWVEVRRDFDADDMVELELPMAPRFTTARPEVDAVRGCLAVERGPEVLCLESVDLPTGVGIEHVDNVVLDPSTAPRYVRGRVVVRGRRRAATASSDQNPTSRIWPYERAATRPDDSTGPSIDLTLVPYHDWANRGPSTMRVWLPIT